MDERHRDYYGDAAFSTGQGDYRPLRGGFFPAVADDAYAYGASGAPRPRSHHERADAPTISCLEPSKLPSIFGPDWNNELAAPQTAFYEEKIQ